MKKLAILTAVAALAAFGWVNAASAGGIVQSGAACSRVLNLAGVEDDTYLLSWTNQGGGGFLHIDVHRDKDQRNR